MNLRLFAACAAVAVTAPAHAQPAEQVTVIHAGTLIAQPGQAPLRNATVVIRGRQIAEVRQGFQDVPGARVVDLRSATVMPGLIDSHVHLRGLDDRLQARLQENSLDHEDNAYIAMLNGRKTLLAGFTTVRDLGADPRQITSLRDAINAGSFAGPTIVAAGSGISGSGPARCFSPLGASGTRTRRSTPPARPPLPCPSRQSAREFCRVLQ